MRKPDDAAPVAYTYPTLPTIEPPSQPSSATNTPSGRPIKPLVFPSSVKKAAKKTPPDITPKAKVVDEPRPPAMGSSLSGKRAKTGPFQVRTPSPTGPVDISEDDDEDRGSEETESEEEVDSDDSFSTTPRKSPRRTTAKVLDEFKCASLSSTIKVTKPVSRVPPSASTSAAAKDSASVASKAMPSSSHPSNHAAESLRSFPVPIETAPGAEVGFVAAMVFRRSFGT